MQKRPIVVLGSRGMLGQMVVEYFQAKTRVVILDRRYQARCRGELIANLAEHPDATIINCIGQIPQKQGSLEDMFFVNLVLPLDIAQSLKGDQVLLQPSTDCVFDGSTQETWYPLSHRTNSQDPYGRSKALAEEALLDRKNTYIIRTSIIGPDRESNNPKGLLGWLLAHADGATLRGYTNHLWNGITTLQWCRFVEHYILSDNKKQLTGKVLQIGSPRSCTKYELLTQISQKYKRKFTIIPHESERWCNRALEPVFAQPDLNEQLNDLYRLELARQT